MKKRPANQYPAQLSNVEKKRKAVISKGTTRITQGLP
jgi:hypothetical protein